VWRLQDETLLIHVVNYVVAIQPKFTVRVTPATSVRRVFQFAVDHFAKEAPWPISIEDIRVILDSTPARININQTFQEIGAEDGDSLELIPGQRGD
jgi:hypothetical protein